MERLSNPEKKNTFFGGAAILTVGVIIVKLIGALYKIPLANILGEEGNGYFMTAYNIYSVLLTISTGGLPVSLSKSVSEARALGKVNQERRIFWVGLSAFFTLGILSFLVMSFGAGPITVLMNNPGAYYAALALAPSVLFVCCISAIRGYAQGQGNMVPTAISQIIEALSKLIVGLTCAYLFLHYADTISNAVPALNGAQPLEMAAAGAILGVTAGTIASFCYLVCSHINRTHRDTRRGTDTPQPKGTILANLVKVAIPITIGSSVVPIVNALDTGIVQGRLQSALNMTVETASSLYGNYSAVGNLYSLPSALMVPFTAALIPAISAARARRAPLEAAKVSESAMRVAMLLACPMGFGLFSLATPIVKLLYPGYDSSIAGPILTILGIASICTCIVTLCNAILQASGFLNLPILTMVIGGVLKIIVNYTLVGIESINVTGAAVGTLCCFGAAALLDLFVIHRVLPAAPDYGRIFFKPVLSSVIMALAAWACYGLVYRFTDSNTLGVLVAIVIAVVLYFALVLALKAISKDDLSLMPKGDKIAKLLRIQ